MMRDNVLLHEAALYIDTIAALGEGAIWDHRAGAFYWIDIEGGKVFTHDPANMRMKSIAVGQRIGTVVPWKSGQVIVALQKGIYKLDLSSEALQLMASAPFDPSYIRFNDGKCDPAGRFWVGSMALNSEAKAAALYRYGLMGSMVEILDNISVSNGICWSIDRKKMYYIDTPTQVVQVFDYDDGTGDIRNGRVIIDLTEEEGSPDGMVIDSEGHLWIALWGGSSVVCYDPDTGRLLARVRVPAKNVTSCTFGGADLQKLFITTASIGMTREDHERYPLSGAVFVATPGVRGVENFHFSD